MSPCWEEDVLSHTSFRRFNLVHSFQDSHSCYAAMHLVEPSRPNDALFVYKVGACHAILTHHLQYVIVSESKAEFLFLCQYLGSLWRALYVNG